jgi:ribonuclease HII
MKLFSFDDPLLIEAGCDEAGRGCLAGPVFAAAVILPKDFDNEMLNDSKQLSLKKRELLRVVIEKEAISWGVAIADNLEIDAHNIANASYMAMNRAVEKLAQKPESLLIDGKYFKTKNTIPYKCIIKGDSKYASIAAASILAKTYRDDFMHDLASQYPAYAWEINKGYPTEKHRKAIFSFGITPHHRTSFRLLPE